MVNLFLSSLHLPYILNIPFIKSLLVRLKAHKKKILTKQRKGTLSYKAYRYFDYKQRGLLRKNVFSDTSLKAIWQCTHYIAQIPLVTSLVNKPQEQEKYATYQVLHLPLKFGLELIEIIWLLSCSSWSSSSSSSSSSFPLLLLVLRLVLFHLLPEDHMVP